MEAAEESNLSPAVHDELTEAMLAALHPTQQKQLLGDRLFPLVQPMQPDLAGRITGMLLQMGNPDIRLLIRSPPVLLIKAQEALEVLLLSWQNVLPGTTPILPDTKVRAPMRGLDDYVPPARRPLLTPRQLATMPPPERMLLLEYRLFYSVHQLQPLMSKYITDALLTAAVNNSTAQGWRQEGRRWLKAAALETAEKVLCMLDQPAELARLVISTVEALGLSSIPLPAGLRLRSDSEVMAAAAGLAPEGQALPWAPLPGVHHRFPPAFRSAARALLLCRSRVRRLVAAAEAGRSDAVGQLPPGVMLLDSLPEGLVQPILAAAAHPLEAWS